MERSRRQKRKKYTKIGIVEEKDFVTEQQFNIIEKLSQYEEDQEDVLVDDVELEDIQTFDSKLVVQSSGESSEKSLKMLSKSRTDKNRRKKRDGTKGEDDGDSDEERWLDAIESGKLEEVDDELKRMKNPLLMTARQRALLEKRSTDVVEEGTPVIPAEPLVALPSGFKERVLTEEMLLKKAMKSKRRREQAIEKREEDKKKTVDRLLKKQDAKICNRSGRVKSMKKEVPLMTYLNNRGGVFLSFPATIEIPFGIPQVQREPPKPVTCGAEGCFNIKKYSCSKTNIPLCSLQCYKKNLESADSMAVVT